MAAPLPPLLGKYIEGGEGLRARSVSSFPDRPVRKLSDSFHLCKMVDGYEEQDWADKDLTEVTMAGKIRAIPFNLLQPARVCRRAQIAFQLRGIERTLPRICPLLFLRCGAS